MSAGLKGDIGKLRRLERSLRELPRVVGQEVAAASAGVITQLGHQTFDAGENAYADTWKPREDGKRATLKGKSGKLGQFAYTSTGTRLRARLGPRYARYQVGARPILPRNGARLPERYVQALSVKANAIIRRHLGAQ